MQWWFMFIFLRLQLQYRPETKMAMEYSESLARS